MAGRSPDVVPESYRESAGSMLRLTRVEKFEVELCESRNSPVVETQRDVLIEKGPIVGQDVADCACYDTS